MQTIDRDIDVYLNDLAKPRTHGTLVELRALAHLFARNVMLFEEFDTGHWLIQEPAYADNACLMLFCTAENHFDSVYEQAYIEDAAYCQALCYEILYTNVFKLPDVEYAVERMLHDPTDGTVINTTTYLSNEFYDEYEESILLSDQRYFRLDRPETTRCVLEDYRMCHFHNAHFDDFWMHLRAELVATDGAAAHDQHEKVRKMLQSLLPHKHQSCVRQLLNEGITPFSYKVAKALDPCIYRNIEYDTWSEMRREQRLRHWNMGHQLQVGSRCRVRLYANQAQPMTCNIQEILSNIGKCVVFVEQLADKRCVPFSAITSMDFAYHHQHGRYQQSRGGGDQTKATKYVSKKSNTATGVVQHGKRSNRDGSTNPMRYEYSKQAINAPLLDKECKYESGSKEATIAGDDIGGGGNHYLDSNANEHSFSVSHLTSTTNFRPPSDYEVVAAPVIVGGSAGCRTTPSKMHNNGNHRNGQQGAQHYGGSKGGPNAKGKMMGSKGRLNIS